jgi:hypothetical protein
MIRFILFAILLIGLSCRVMGQDTTFCKYENDSMILSCGCVISFICFIDYENNEDTMGDCYSDYVIRLFEKYPVEKIEISFNASSYKKNDDEKTYTDKSANKCRNELIKHGFDTTKVKVLSNGNMNPIYVSYENNERYNFLPVGAKLDYGFIESLKSKEEKLVAHSLNRRTEIKIIEMKNSR